MAAGAELIIIESITEQVAAWRTDAIQFFAQELGLAQVMFEAADPAVFDWYVRTFGRDLNLFVDSQPDHAARGVARGRLGHG